MRMYEARYAYGLCLMEKQIIEHVIEGLTNSEIAVEMNLSADTIGRYITKIHRKMATSRRTELVAKWIREQE